jgi:hypothetical protein
MGAAQDELELRLWINNRQPRVNLVDQEGAGLGTSQRIVGEGFKVLAGNGKNFV